MSTLKLKMDNTKDEHDKLIEDLRRTLYRAREAEKHHYHARLSTLRLVVELYELTPDKEEFSIRHLQNVPRSAMLPELKAQLAEMEADNTLVPELNTNGAV